MPKVIIITLIILIAILLGLYFIKGSFAPKKTVQPQPILTAPSYPPKPSYEPTTKMPIPTPADLKPLQVVNVEPKEDISLDHNPITEIKFRFSDDIDVDNFLLEVLPDTQIRIIPQTKTHTYIISPKDSWPEGINTFTIKAGTKSLSGAILRDTFVYKINIQFPKNPPADADI